MKKNSNTKTSVAPVIAGAYHGDNSTRYTFRNKNTEEQKAAILARTVKNEPKNHILLKQVFLEAHKLGIPNSRVMKAMGGHRGLKYPPLNDNWKGVYYKRSWWLPKACLKDLPKLLVMPKKQSGPKPKAEKKIVEKPASKKIVVKPKPKAEPEDMVMDLTGSKAGQFRKMTKKEKADAQPKTVRDGKGKVIPKAKPEDIPGTPVVLKKKPRMTTEEAIADLGFEPKEKSKLSTTRTTGASIKPVEKKMKRTINEAGIPVMELVDQEG